MSQKDSIDANLKLLKLVPLMMASTGNPSMVIGLIDGPVDLTHPAFANLHVRTVRPNHLPMCQNADSVACSHGTAIAGVLFASRGVFAPAICPGCTALLYPFFPEHPSGSRDLPETTPGELSRAIVETVDAGAKIINLSLGVIASDLSCCPELDEACEYAARRGVVLVAASGNQGRIGFPPLARHPWTIPVAACDQDGTVTPESNIGRTIGIRGLRAPGVNVPTTSPGSGYSQISGTSVAAAHITGGFALLWSEFPSMTASDVRRFALLSASRTRHSIIPPLLNVQAARELCRASGTHKEIIMADETTQEAARPAEGVEPVAVPQAGPRSAADADPRRPTIKLGTNHVRGRTVVRAAGGTCPTCAAVGGTENGPPVYVYAIGTVDMRYPSLAIEKEFRQSLAPGQTANLMEDQVKYNVLKANRHLVNEVCWVLTIEGVDTYILVPRDRDVADQLVEAVKPATIGLDVDVIIGTRGPVAPAEMCNGLQTPIVLVDQAYSFERPQLMKAVKKPKESKVTDEEFQGQADRLFHLIQQTADNLGATDEHRALNYLAVRYPDIYTQTSLLAGRELSLAGVEVIPSRLTMNRKLVDVIFSFKNPAGDIVEKYYVRVDVTEKYPFLDKRWTQYYDRQ